MRHRRYTFTGIGSLFITLGVSATLCADQARPSGSATHARDDDPRKASCEADRPSVQIVLVGTKHVASGSLSAATQQAARIWARTGLHLVWTSPEHVDESSACPLLVVLFRPTLTPSGQDRTDARRHARMPLGWLRFDDQGNPGNTIEVSVTSITSLVMSESYAGRLVSAAPQNLQDELVGRAIGRVIAHEIGHWLFGPSHHSDSLMSVVLDGRALVSLSPPAIPRPWVTTVSEQLAIRRPPSRGARAGAAARAKDVSGL